MRELPRKRLTRQPPAVKHRLTCRAGRAGATGRAPAASYLVGGLVDGEGTGDLRSSASVHDTVVAYQVTDDAEGVVEGALGFLNDLPRRHTHSASGNSYNSFKCVPVQSRQGIRKSWEGNLLESSLRSI